MFISGLSLVKSKEIELVLQILAIILIAILIKNFLNLTILYNSLSILFKEN